MTPSVWLSHPRPDVTTSSLDSCIRLSAWTLNTLQAFKTCPHYIRFNSYVCPRVFTKIKSVLCVIVEYSVKGSLQVCPFTISRNNQNILFKNKERLVVLSSKPTKTSHSRALAANRFVGLLVKASASEAEGQGFESRLQQDFSRSSYTSDIGGRNSSLAVFGLAVHSVAGSILLWGNFPVEGTFPLELTWVQTPFPQKLFRMRV